MGGPKWQCHHHSGVCLTLLTAVTQHNVVKVILFGESPLDTNLFPQEVYHIKLQYLLPGRS